VIDLRLQIESNKLIRQMSVRLSNGSIASKTYEDIGIIVNSINIRMTNASSDLGYLSQKLHDRFIYLKGDYESGQIVFADYSDFLKMIKVCLENEAFLPFIDKKSAEEMQEEVKRQLI
jgi:hypothetical protein